MKKIACGLGILIIVAFVSASMAQPAQPKPAPPSPPTERLARFMGVIEKIDEAAKTVEVKGKKSEPLIFITDEKTQITLRDKEASFGELKKGLYVVVDYKLEGTKRIAAAITEGVPRARRR